MCWQKKTQKNCNCVRYPLHTHIHTLKSSEISPLTLHFDRTVQKYTSIHWSIDSSTAVWPLTPTSWPGTVHLSTLPSQGQTRTSSYLLQHFQSGSEGGVQWRRSEVGPSWAETSGGRLMTVWKKGKRYFLRFFKEKSENLCLLSPALSSAQFPHRNISGRARSWVSGKGRSGWCTGVGRGLKYQTQHWPAEKRKVQI